MADAAEMKKIRDSTKKKTRTARGAATERILAALANELPIVHDRKSFIDSASLARQFGKDSTKLSAQERDVAARTLGRLIGESIVGEALFPRGDSPKVNFVGAGLIAVAINLDRLSRERERWKRRHQAWQQNHQTWVRTSSGAEPAEPIEPKQERTIAQIIQDTHAWCAASKNGPLSLVILNIAIVHGSSDFDLLISVLYKNNDEFMQYIREVVQRASFVQKTHTMQIGGWIGFPYMGRSIS